MLTSHSKTKQFGKAGFLIIKDAFNAHAPIVVTPHSLAETSNLIGRDTRDKRIKAARVRFTQFVSETIEVFHAAMTLSAEQEWNWLGITDVAQLRAAIEREATLLTADHALHEAALRQGLSSINLAYEITRRTM